MKKRLLSLLLAVLMILSLAPGALAADIGPDTALHSKAEIARYMSQFDYQKDVDDTFATAPDCKNPPYRAGTISDRTRANALAIVNTVRYVAGLPEVTSDAQYEAYAQAAALVNAVNDDLSHYPDKPENMSDEMYKQCYYGSYQSNLSYGRQNLYHAVVYGWMADSDDNNIGTVGHRRWILNPDMAKTGFGVVPLNEPGRNTCCVLAMYVTDFGRTNAPETIVTWPARYMPYRLFSPYVPWSVSIDAELNPDTVSVTLQRQGDGRTWKFSKTASDGYFTVDTSPGAGGQCIIFRPDEGMGMMEDDGSALPGEVYTVTVTGALDKTIRYTVEFFDPENYTDDPVTPQPTNPFKDVKSGAFYYDPVLWAVKQGITDGTSATTFSPDKTCTRGQVVTFLWRANGCPEPKSSNNPFKDVKSSDYFYKAVLWAVEKGITDGTSATTFSPGASCTRAHVVTFLWRAEGEPKASGSNPFKDVSAKAYYYQPVLWAVNHKPQITDGVSATSFAPDKPCTRGQIVTFLYRDLG